MSAAQDSWTQATLPVGLGGLGLRRAADVALPAYLSSMAAASHLTLSILTPFNVAELGVADALEEWRSRVDPSTVPPSDLSAHRQRDWDTPMSAFMKDDLLSRSDQRSRARLLAAAAPRSGCWVEAIPSPTVGTQLDPETLRVALSLRIGARICEPHKCRCGSSADSLGYHMLSCRLNAGRFPRHAALNDVILRALRRAGVPAVLEPSGLDRGDGKRPDGITLIPYANGKSLCWDATCVNTFGEGTLNNSAMHSGSSALAAEEAKRRKYAALTDRFLF